MKIKTATKKVNVSICESYSGLAGGVTVKLSSRKNNYFLWFGEDLLAAALEKLDGKFGGPGEGKGHFTYHRKKGGWNSVPFTWLVASRGADYFVFELEGEFSLFLDHDDVELLTYALRNPKTVTIYH